MGENREEGIIVTGQENAAGSGRDRRVPCDLHDAGTRPPLRDEQSSARWLVRCRRWRPYESSSPQLVTHTVTCRCNRSCDEPRPPPPLSQGSFRHHWKVETFPSAQSSAGSSYRILPTSYRPVARRLSSTST
jgi:hypothetical protein